MRVRHPLGRPAVFVRSTRLNHAVVAALHLHDGRMRKSRRLRSMRLRSATAGRQLADRSNRRRWRADPRHTGGLPEALVDPSRRAEPAARRRILLSGGSAGVSIVGFDVASANYCQSNSQRLHQRLQDHGAAEHERPDHAGRRQQPARQRLDEDRYDDPPRVQFARRRPSIRATCASSRTT